MLNVLEDYYKCYNLNVYCGVYILGLLVIDGYENVCEIVCCFINVKYFEEIIFICGIIVLINFVVYSYGDVNVEEGDEIVVIEMEYYVNIVFW